MRSGITSCVARLLKEPNIDVNRVDLLGWTPLHYASYTGQKDIVAVLIVDDRCKLKMKNSKGKTALQLAKTKDIAVIIKKFKPNRAKRTPQTSKDSFRETVNRSRPRPESILQAQRKEEKEMKSRMEEIKREGIIIAKVCLRVCICWTLTISKKREKNATWAPVGTPPAPHNWITDLRRSIYSEPNSLDFDYGGKESKPSIKHVSSTLTINAGSTSTKRRGRTTLFAMEVDGDDENSQINGKLEEED